MLWSIVIATWNRSRLLTRTLDSLLRMRCPEETDWELWVVDNASTDDTPDLAQRFQEQFQGRLHYLHESTQGKSHALNHALKRVRGQWVLFLDDDVLVNPGLLEGYIRGLRDHPEALCLAGAIDPWVEGPLSNRQKWLLQEYPVQFSVLQVTQDRKMIGSDTGWGANMAVRRSSIPAEGFSIDQGMFAGRRIAGEDVNMLLTVLKSGGEGWLLADATVQHYMPRNRVSLRAMAQGQIGMGRQWRLERGTPEPGRWGVAWWAWRELIRRYALAAAAWRPWLTRKYCDRILAANQYRGYLLD